MKQIKICQLYLYPVKSLQGISVEQMSFDNFGPVHDRRWVLVDQDYKFLTQRSDPDLAKFKVEIKDDKLQISLKSQSVDVAIDHRSLEKKQITVWTHQGESYDCGNKVSDFFSSHLGKKIFLFKMAESFNRKTSSQSSDISFVDARQVLIANKKSLNWLNSEIKKENEEVIPMNRFRANIIIDEEEFLEEKINLLKNEKLEFHLEKKCGRCVVITTDQEGAGRQSTLPLKILAKRNKETSFGVYFTAKNLIPNASCKKGDFLQIIS